MLQVLAALDLVDLAAHYPDSTYADRAAALLAEALAACSREEVEALLVEGPAEGRQAALLELGRRAFPTTRPCSSRRSRDTRWI